MSEPPPKFAGWPNRFDVVWHLGGLYWLFIYPLSFLLDEEALSIPPLHVLCNTNIQPL